MARVFQFVCLISIVVGCESRYDYLSRKFTALEPQIRPQLPLAVKMWTTMKDPSLYEGLAISKTLPETDYQMTVRIGQKVTPFSYEMELIAPVVLAEDYESVVSVGEPRYVVRLWKEVAPTRGAIAEEQMMSEWELTEEHFTQILDASDKLATIKRLCSSE